MKISAADNPAARCVVSRGETDTDRQKENRQQSWACVSLLSYLAEGYLEDVPGLAADGGVPFVRKRQEVVEDGVEVTPG